MGAQAVFRDIGRQIAEVRAQTGQDRETDVEIRVPGVLRIAVGTRAGCLPHMVDGGEVNAIVFRIAGQGAARLERLAFVGIFVTDHVALARYAGIEVQTVEVAEQASAGIAGEIVQSRVGVGRDAVVDDFYVGGGAGWDDRAVHDLAHGRGGRAVFVLFQLIYLERDGGIAPEYDVPVHAVLDVGGIGRQRECLVNGNAVIPDLDAGNVDLKQRHLRGDRGEVGQLRAGQTVHGAGRIRDIVHHEVVGRAAGKIERAVEIFVSWR